MNSCQINESKKNDFKKNEWKDPKFQNDILSHFLPLFICGLPFLVYLSTINKYDESFLNMLATIDIIILTALLIKMIINIQRL
jgi:hypothetical protein